MFILDSYVTHTKNLLATNVAREAGVGLVSLPPHTTQRFQPLGGAFLDRLGNTTIICIEDVDERTCRQTSDNMASCRNS